MAQLTEIRWHGRGGQGAKTASTLVAEAAVAEGKYSQGFPEYGPERMGAPMRGFTRLSDEPIPQHCAIENPQMVVVLDDSLLRSVDVCSGVPDDGVVLVNTKMSFAEVRDLLSNHNVRVGTVDATGISIDEIGRDIPNTPMIGALVRATGLLKTETVTEDFRQKYGKKFRPAVLDGNVRAVERAHEEVAFDE